RQRPTARIGQRPSRSASAATGRPRQSTVGASFRSCYFLPWRRRGTRARLGPREQQPHVRTNVRRAVDLNTPSELLHILEALVSADPHAGRFCRLKWLEQALTHEFGRHPLARVADLDQSQSILFREPDPHAAVLVGG